mmetsp:Transcript_9996/g.23821  ORF Transcript_9996/g.23821 Transcript_9996/m.23821 type:complete len:202 (+) Transcript_9996:323-928(+)
MPMLNYSYGPLCLGPRSVVQSCLPLSRDMVWISPGFEQREDRVLAAALRCKSETRVTLSIHHVHIPGRLDECSHVHRHTRDGSHVQGCASSTNPTVRICLQHQHLLHTVLHSALHSRIQPSSSKQLTDKPPRSQHIWMILLRCGTRSVPEDHQVQHGISQFQITTRSCECTAHQKILHALQGERCFRSFRPLASVPSTFVQ